MSAEDTGSSGMMAALKRIGVIFALTFQEARRRRLLVIFLVGCVVFMGSGSACTYGCRKLADAGINQQRAQIEARMQQQGLPKAEQAEKLKEIDDLLAKDRLAGESTLRSGLVAICFGLIVFWAYLLAAFFTPFLALNDFFTGHHVLLLSRPVRRWEYLTGKFVATTGTLLASIGLLLICYVLLMRFSTDAWGLELLRGLLFALQGLIVFVLMLMLLTLTVGRLPAAFVALLVVGLGAMPGYLIATETDLGDASIGGRLLVYGLAYGLPQFTVNLMHSFAWMVEDMESFAGYLQQSGLRKIGNNTGAVSIALNFGWMLLFALGLQLVFRRKELRT